MTEFPLPYFGSGPRAIVAGPDGALWFTEEAIAKVGRITTRGAASEFPLPANPLAPAVGISAGPDGALWLTQPGALNAIGRITTGGALTEFPLPAGSFSPLAIVAGPDGALWFTEQGAARIGRITTGGTITEFPVPNGGLPGGIARGPDGALWFTDGFPVAKIGRITTSGALWGARRGPTMKARSAASKASALSGAPHVCDSYRMAGSLPQVLYDGRGVPSSSHRPQSKPIAV